MKKAVLTLMLALVAGTSYADNEDFVFMELYRSCYAIIGPSNLCTLNDTDTYHVKIKPSLRFNFIKREDFAFYGKWESIHYLDIFRQSFPFSEHIFSPGLNCEWYRDKHRIILAYEHQSNGTDDADSRGFNYLYAEYLRRFDLENGGNVWLGAKTWFGYGNIGNPRYFWAPYKYYGLFRLSAQYHSANDRFHTLVSVAPYDGCRRVSIKAEVYFRPAKYPGVPSLMIQYGYGLERQLDFFDGKDFQPHQYLRFGIAAVPNFLNP